MSLSEGETVATVEVTVKYRIRVWRTDEDKPVYDWIDNSGEDSAELFNSVEEARRDIDSRYY